MITLKVPKKFQLTLFASIAISLITGVLFFILKTWVLVEGEFGFEKHPWQYPTLKIHAASAFFIMLCYGAMWASHIELGWRSKRSRRTGIIIASVIGLQVITAYLLYYLSNENIRLITEYTHLAVGISIPLALYVHIRLAQKKRLSTQQSNTPS